MGNPLRVFLLELRTTEMRKIKKQRYRNKKESDDEDKEDKSKTVLDIF